MDNWPCSANIKLLNEEMAEEVNAMEVFDLMEINCAMVEKDMITITYLEIKRVLDKKGVKRAISGPLKGPNVQVLKELPPVCLNVSGIRFGNETAIKMNVRKVDLNKTVLEQDPFISAVGQPKEQTGDAAPGTSSERRKLLVCPFCETSRTFPTEEKLKSHISFVH